MHLFIIVIRRAASPSRVVRRRRARLDVRRRSTLDE